VWRYNQAKIYVIQWSHHVAIQESDKSSNLTGNGRTLCVSKKLLYTICDVRHPHEMVLIEPSHVFLDEMVCNQDDHLAFELRSFPGVSKISIGVGILLFLASEVGTKLIGHILWKDVCWVDEWVTEVKHTQILLLFGGSVNPYSKMGLLLPLTAGRVFLICIGCCGITLTSVMLFGHESGVGSGTRCTIYEGILIFLP
jgi:hypothetical protein